MAANARKLDAFYISVFNTVILFIKFIIIAYLLTQIYLKLNKDFRD